MTYAFILLSLVAVLTWSAWSGHSAPELERSLIQEQAVHLYERVRTRITGAVKDKVREELHEAVDERLE